MKPLSILVVDDDRDHADSLGELLVMRGHDVEVAYSGAGAIAAYDRRNFDIGFMDVIMPGKDGVQSFLEIRQRCPNALIYMMTGYTVEQLLCQAAENGALGVIGKPFDISAVTDAIDAVRPAGLVLVTDDAPAMGETLHATISAGPIACKLATGRSEALLCVDRGDVEVLILDLKTPLIDGISVYLALRDRGKAIPTVIVTDSIDADDACGSVSGFEKTGILTKPFSPEDFLDRMDQLSV